MIKYTLVPVEFFSPAEAHSILSEVCELHPNDKISYKELPHFKAVLVYAHNGGEEVPPVATLLEKLAALKDHNRIAALLENGFLHLCIAEGEKLLLANTFPAADPVTAEYFIFASLNRFQINPQVSIIHIDAPKTALKNDLLSYFKGVRSL